jgi:hypothetical protein
MDGMTINHIVSIDHGSYEIHHVQPRLASPFPVTVVLWGGYAWRSIDDGPPGCEGRNFHGIP